MYKFKSRYKELRLRIKGDKVIEFSNYTYRTNDSEEADFLKKSPDVELAEEPEKQQTKEGMKEEPKEEERPKKATRKKTSKK